MNICFVCVLTVVDDEQAVDVHCEKDLKIKQQNIETSTNKRDQAAGGLRDWYYPVEYLWGPSRLTFS